MSKNLRIIIICSIFLLVILVSLLVYIGKNKNDELDNGKINIVTTTFSVYDFSKQIVGDNANVIFLLGPGVESHGYEPTPKDILKMQNSDILIYVGGEMEDWMNRLLETGSINENITKIIKISDSVETIDEVEIDGAEKEKEDEMEGSFDEHIWTSPKNAIKMVEYLKNKFSEIDEENESKYKENAEKYIKQIKEVQADIQEIVNNKKRDRLVFGDKMPMQYFLNEYDLKASAAFNGCSTELEPGIKTITYLVNKVKEEKIPVILYIELSTGKTANMIAKETGTEAIQIQTMHNISKEDFYKGETYVSLMKRNLEVLKKALQ